MTRFDSVPFCCTATTEWPPLARACGGLDSIYNALPPKLLEGLPMPRLHPVAAALLVLAVAAPGCSRNRNIPVQLAPARMTTIGVNAYLWRAAIDTVSFAPLLQADANTGVIITDWYTNPKSPGERA